MDSSLERILRKRHCQYNWRAAFEKDDETLDNSNVNIICVTVTWRKVLSRKNFALAAFPPDTQSSHEAEK